MPGVSMEITLDDAEARSAIARLAEFPGERSASMWDAIGAAMVASTKMRFFQTQTSPDGVPWKPSQRFLKDGAPPTLTERGYLRDSNTHNVIGEGVEWGSAMVYAAIHQDGGDIRREAGTHTLYRKVSKSGELSPRFVKRSQSNFAQDVMHGGYTIHMPARPYLGVSAEDEATIEEIAQRHLEAALLDASPNGL